jgi:hypothetical protein
MAEYSLLLLMATRIRHIRLNDGICYEYRVTQTYLRRCPTHNPPKKPKRGRKQ